MIHSTYEFIQSSQNLVRQVIVIIPVRHIVKLRQQEVDNLPKVTSVINARAGIWTHAIKASLSVLLAHYVMW